MIISRIEHALVLVGVTIDPAGRSTAVRRRPRPARGDDQAHCSMHHRHTKVSDVLHAPPCRGVDAINQHATAFTAHRDTQRCSLGKQHGCTQTHYTTNVRSRHIIGLKERDHGDGARWTSRGDMQSGGRENDVSRSMVMETATWDLLVGKQYWKRTSA